MLCVLLLPFLWGLCDQFLFGYSVLCVVSLVCYHLDEEKRADCLNLFVLLMSCDCKGLVALPRGDVGRSIICGCGIS